MQLHIYNIFDISYNYTMYEYDTNTRNFYEYSLGDTLKLNVSLNEYKLICYNNTVWMITETSIQEECGQQVKSTSFSWWLRNKSSFVEKSWNKYLDSSIRFGRPHSPWTTYFHWKNLIQKPIQLTYKIYHTKTVFSPGIIIVL